MIVIFASGSVINQGFLLLSMDNYLINCEAFCSLIITPIVTYSEPGEQKSKILSENNNKSGIY